MGPQPTYFIHVGPQEIARLEQGWETRGGRAPDAEVLESLIQSHIDDELLISQARDLGWHRNDAIIQRRLVQNQRFLLVICSRGSYSDRKPSARPCRANPSSERFSLSTAVAQIRRISAPDWSGESHWGAASR